MISLLAKKTGKIGKTSMVEMTRSPGTTGMLRMLDETGVMMIDGGTSGRGPETTRKSLRMLEIEIDLTRREISRGPKIHHVTLLHLPKRQPRLPSKRHQSLLSRSNKRIFGPLLKRQRRNPAATLRGLRPLRDK